MRTAFDTLAASVGERDELLQVDRVVEAALRARVDVADDARCLAELAQDLDVIVGEVGATLRANRRPIAVLRNLDAALVRHLQEEQVRDPLDIGAVVDAVVTERVTEAHNFWTTSVIASFYRCDAPDVQRCRATSRARLGVAASSSPVFAVRARARERRPRSCTMKSSVYGNFSMRARRTFGSR